MNHGPVLERLDAERCWELLETHSFGRICFCVGGRTEIVLTAFVARERTIYFRASAFGPVARLARSRPVTLQVDDLVDGQPAGWSVTVTGASERLSDAPTLAALWAPVRPLSWDSGAELTWMMLSGDDVRGQRVRRDREARVGPTVVPLTGP